MENKKPEEVAKEIIQQESELQFGSFSSEDALKLGMRILEHAKKETKPVAIDITIGNHTLFHYAMDGTSPDNAEWIRRKNNSVMRFNHASYWLYNSLLVKGKTLEQSSFISEEKFSTHGGAFPLIIRGVGVVGTITMSGLKQQEDHGIVVQSIREHLDLKK